MKVLIVFLLTSFFSQAGNCLSYGAPTTPTPDPLYKTEYELEKEVVQDEVYVSRVVLGIPFRSNEYKYVIRNSSDEPFYTLVELDNGFDWKEIAMKGYLFKAWLRPKVLHYFSPGSGGWTAADDEHDRKDEEIKNHTIHILKREYVADGWPENAQGETVLTYNIPVLKDGDIQEVVLKRKAYMVDGYAVNSLSYWFDENPIDSLKIVNPSRNPEESWYFQISEDDEEGVIFLLKYHKTKEVFEDIPKEYYPSSRLMNNTRLSYGCGLYSDCEEPTVSTVIPYMSWNFKVKIPGTASMPDKLEVPPPEKIEVPCLYKGEVCSIKGVRRWIYNDEFVPLEDKGKASQLNSINSNWLNSILKGVIFCSPVFLNMLLFFGLQFKKISTLGYFKAFEFTFLFSFVDFSLFYFGVEHIPISYLLLYPFGFVLGVAFCWAIVKLILIQFFKKKLLIDQLKLFLICWCGCLIVTWFSFWAFTFLNGS